MRPPWRRYRERAFLLRQRRTSSAWNLAGMESGQIPYPSIHGHLRGPTGSLRSLRRPHAYAIVPCLGHRWRLIGLDRLHPSMAKAFLAILASNPNGIRRHHCRTSHRPIDGLVDLPCHPGPRSSFLRNPLRFGTERNPLFDLPRLSGRKGRSTVGFHSRPWYGETPFHRCLNFPASLSETVGSAGN